MEIGHRSLSLKVMDGEHIRKITRGFPVCLLLNENGTPITGLLFSVSAFESACQNIVALLSDKGSVMFDPTLIIEELRTLGFAASDDQIFEGVVRDACDNTDLGGIVLKFGHGCGAFYRNGLRISEKFCSKIQIFLAVFDMVFNSVCSVEQALLLFKTACVEMESMTPLSDVKIECKKSIPEPRYVARKDSVFFNYVNIPYGAIVLSDGREFDVVTLEMVDRVLEELGCAVSVSDGVAEKVRAEARRHGLVPDFAAVVQCILATGTGCPSSGVHSGCGVLTLRRCCSRECKILTPHWYLQSDNFVSQDIQTLRKMLWVCIILTSEGLQSPETMVAVFKEAKNSGMTDGSENFVGVCDSVRAVIAEYELDRLLSCVASNTSDQTAN